MPMPTTAPELSAIPPEVAAVIAALPADYDEDSIQVLRDREHIRKRPDNYIPDTQSRGLHHLVYELVYNAVDEHLAGACSIITVTMHVDGSVSVADNGRGIPVELHTKENKPTLDVVLTVVGSGGKFDNNAYKTSAGLHGMGAKAVTALSELTRVEVRRNGRLYRREYFTGLLSEGQDPTLVRDYGPADTTGTKLQFWPDRTIFLEAAFAYELLEDRLRELAFLNRGLTIVLVDENTAKTETFMYQGGIGEYAAWLNRDDHAIHIPIYINNTVNDIKVEVAFQYYNGDLERMRCYANNAYNPNGGTHQSGFRAALTYCLNNYADKEGLYPKDLRPVGDDFRQGMTAIVSVGLARPHFESQTKVRLNNPEVEGAVRTAMTETLNRWLEENPKEAKRIISKVLLTAEEREAQAKARDAVRKRKNILGGGGLPGKLLDCTDSGENTELFLVEGDSAGGSAESGRDRRYQAILPLRGKPLNVEKAQTEQMLKNDEITSIIAAVGTDIGNPDDISKLRYGRIVILTDADVDGQHIRTLLLTFFYRQMGKLVETGHIYVARPPLYKIKHKKTVRFVQTNEEMHTEMLARGRADSALVIHTGSQPRRIEGEELLKLMELLDRTEAAVSILERRGIPLSTFVPLAVNGVVPTWHVKSAGHDHWLRSAEEVEAFRASESARLGHEVVVASGTMTAENANEDTTHLMVNEYQEMRRLNQSLPELDRMGLSLPDLIPPIRIAGREPPMRFELVRDEFRKTLNTLRALVPAIRSFGEKGLEITRFKGLGEMDPEELWETTLDPAKRTMLKVTLDDANAANELFRTLMGEEVDKRRAFIFERGINVRDSIDYGS